MPSNDFCDLAKATSTWQCMWPASTRSNAEGCYRSKKSDKKKSSSIAKYYLLPSGSLDYALVHMEKLLI